jgi:hypothetical protein
VRLIFSVKYRGQGRLPVKSPCRRAFPSAVVRTVLPVRATLEQIEAQFGHCGHFTGFSLLSEQCDVVTPATFCERPKHRQSICTPFGAFYLTGSASASEQPFRSGRGAEIGRLPHRPVARALLSRFSGFDTGQTSCTYPFSVFTRLSCTKL